MIEPHVSEVVHRDGYRAHLERWEPDQVTLGRVVILHGVQSHGGWYHNLGRTLAGRGYAAWFPDRRGSGKNQEARGHASSSGQLIDDVVDVLRLARSSEPIRPLALAGISWGGKLAVVAAAKYRELVDGLALICPGLHPRVDVSRGDRLRIALAYFTRPKTQFPIPLADPSLFTGSVSGQAFIAKDPLGLRTASASLLAASRFLDRRVSRVRGSVRQPCLLMLGGLDRIVDNAKTAAYFEAIGSGQRHTIEYPEGHHTLEFESDPARYANDLADWLGANLVVPPGVRGSNVSASHEG